MVRAVRNALYFFFGVALAALFFSPYAFAQFRGNYNGIPTEVVGPYSDFRPKLFNPGGGAGATSKAFIGGVEAEVLGKATATLPTGTKVDIPIGAKATINKAAIARAAKLATRAMGPIGAASLGWDIYQEIADSGFVTCPPPEFFCKAEAVDEHYVEPVPGTVRWFYNGQYASDAQTICETSGLPYAQQVYPTRNIASTQFFVSNGKCEMYNAQGVWQSGIAIVPVKQTGTYCPDGGDPVGGQCHVSAQPQQNYTDAELEQAFQDKLTQNPEFAKKYWDAAWRDINAGRLSVSEFDMVPPESPVDVTAPPVTGPKEQIRREEIPLADGSTDTKIYEQETTITPQVTGNTAADASISYKYETTTTVTTTNNVTNITNVETVTEEGNAQDRDESFNDPAFGDVPKLYDQKYPDGIGGVWRDHKPNLQGTQFWAGVQSMFPSFGGGQCPAWSMTFDILPGLANYGTVPFDLPCWIFQAVGLILLTTAAFTARKIIF